MYFVMLEKEMYIVVAKNGSVQSAWITYAQAAEVAKDLNKALKR